MKYNNVKGLKVPYFTLGTVQLGMDYGFGEFSKKPTMEYAGEILNTALDFGVNHLDTANNYGDAERVIGEWLKTVPESKRPIITTKIGPLDHSSKMALRDDIFKQTEGCLAALGVDCIDILMLHNFEDYANEPKVTAEVFSELKATGKIKHTAISAYSEHDYRVLAKSGFDAVQIPINIFDLEKIENGELSALAEAGIMIFARSVFLQGIIFLERENIDNRMSFALPYLDKFHALCREFDMAPEVLCASFVLSLPGVTSLVLGCQTTKQVEANCELIEKAKRLTDEQMEKIKFTFRNVDKRLINPRLWFNSGR